MTRTLAQKTAFMCSLVCGLATPVHAQTPAIGDPGSAARIQFGPFGLTPRIAVNNLGMDANVFNAAGQPQRDFTVAVVPGADAFLRLGRVRLASKTQFQMNYFQKSASQRSVNISQDGRFEVDLFRIIPFATVTYVKTRQRPNLEIDERVAQFRTVVSLGSQVPVGSKVRLDVEMRRENLDLGRSQSGNPDLAQALNRTATDVTIAGRMALTSLTTLVVRSIIQRDRFEFSPLRDSNRTLVESGAEFKPTALLSGQAFVGFQRFATLRDDVPDYVGLVASVDVNYTVRDTTRVGARIDRDVDYSIESTQPFFVTTSTEVEVTQVVGSAWAVAGRAGRTAMAYRAVATAAGAPTIAPRRDTVNIWSVGVSRKLGRLMRVGADAVWSQRTSVQATRAYTGFKLAGFVTYGY